MNINRIVNKIDMALEKKVISKNLSTVPEKGATEDQIMKEEAYLSRPFTSQHRTFLKKYNGLNADMINFYGCGNDLKKGISKITEWQFDKYDEENQDLLQYLIVADTPSGQMILEDKNGEIYIFAYDGLPIEKTASSLEDFICNYVFGKRAAEFAGDEWFDEVKAAGLLEG